MFYAVQNAGTLYKEIFIKGMQNDKKNSIIAMGIKSHRIIFRIVRGIFSHFNVVDQPGR